MKRVLAGRFGYAADLDVLPRIRRRMQLRVRDWRALREKRREALQGPSVQARRDDLIEFFNAFEHFVETVCDAAQYGPNDRLGQEYAAMRKFLWEKWPSLQPIVIAYLRPTAEDMVSVGAATGASADTFSCLLAPESLSAFLSGDDGYMIARITRAREGLMLYGEHLKRLATMT